MASAKNKEARRRAQALARRLEGNEKLLERLEAVLDLAESDQDRSLEEIERLLIGAVRELGSESLGSWVARREEALVQDLRKQHGRLSEREKNFRFHSTFGEVSVEERIWRAPGQSYLRALPQSLGIACRGVSPQLKRVLYDLGVEESYRTANYRLEVHYGFRLSAERIRQVTVDRRVGWSKSRARGSRCAPCRPGGLRRSLPNATAPWYGRSRPLRAGTGANSASWNGRRRGCAAASAAGSASIYYEGLLGSVEKTGIAWSHATARAGWGAHTRIHPMGDGAVWIGQQARLQFPCSVFLLDLFHVCEYLAPAAETCSRREKPSRWCKRQRNKLLKGKATQVIEELCQKSEPAKASDEAAPVRCAYRYLNQRADQLDYPAALARNLSVGTRMIESAHKQIIQKRLKGPGMAWLPANANAIINARAARATLIQNQQSLQKAA